MTTQERLLINFNVHFSSKKVLDALSYCIQQHGDQKRRDGLLYCTHPIRVWNAVTLFLGRNDENIECACLLHDVLEDTNCFFAEIKKLFGSVVAEIVRDLTNDKSLPKKERKDKMIKHARSICNEARIVKCFDRIDNLTSAVDAFNETALWHYLIESGNLYMAMRLGLREDRWELEASKALAKLYLVVDKTAAFCYNEKGMDGLDEFWDLVSPQIRG